LYNQYSLVPKFLDQPIHVNRVIGRRLSSRVNDFIARLSSHVSWRRHEPKRPALEDRIAVRLPLVAALRLRMSEIDLVTTVCKSPAIGAFPY